MHKTFLNIYRFFENRKFLGFSAVFLYTFLIAFLAWNIHLEEDITRLIPNGDKQENLKKVLSGTDFSDKLIISISAREDNVNPDSLVAYANDLTGILENDLSDYIKEIKGKIPDEDITDVYDFVYENLPIFLSPQDYNVISNRLEKDSIKTQITQGYRRLMAPTGFVTKNYFFKDPLNFTSLGLQKLKELQVGDNFSIYRNYLITRDRQNIILFVDPVFPSSETNENEIFINKLQEQIQGLNSNYSYVEGKYFGGVLYSLANANRIKKDILLTVGIAAVVLLILLIFFYRKILIPIILFLPSILGGISGIAFLSVFRGSVSAISLGIGAILLGISIDYALHVMTHYRNNRDVQQLYKDISKPVMMSSLTTAVAFLCLVFLDSPALTDLGLFASVSVLLSSVFALILIPVLYHPKGDKQPKPNFLDRIASVDYSKYRPLVITVILVFVLGLFFFNRVNFNNDLSKLNYKPAEIEQQENEVEHLAGRAGKTIYMVTYGSTVDEALQENNKLYHRLQDLKKENEIKSFSSIGGFILSTATQNQRIESWEEFWTQDTIDYLKQELINVSSEFGFKPESFERFYAELNKDFTPIFLDDYKNTGSLYLDDFISEKSDFATVMSTVNLDEERSDEFVSRFENETGVFALDRKAINQNFLGDLKQDFNKLIAISIFAVFLILLIFYRSLELSILTMIPIAITWISALGIMAVLGLEFNILNIIISTFIFGLGLDYSIFITNACLKEYETGEFDLKTYQTSILISVITTLLGMGALIFAQHPALRSISVVSIIGVLTAVTVSFVIQRILFKHLILNRARSGKPAFHFRKLTQLGKDPNLSETEKLYRKRSILNNYRYKSVYSEVRKRYRLNREQYLQVSQYIEEGEEIAVINSDAGIIPLFLSYKIDNIIIKGLETNSEDLDISKQLPRAREGNITFTDKIEEIESSQVFIINSEVEYEEALVDLMKKRAQKVIFVDTDFPHRWLLDLNFEIVYRQNNILVLRKVD